jgi:imidazolonepropionase-like amidohydrolase
VVQDQVQDSSQGSGASPKTLLLTDARIWNGVDDHYLASADAVRVESGRIVAVGAAEALGSGADVHSCEGRTLLPGLIDAHVHLCLDPDIRSALDQGKETPEELRALIAARCAAMVRAGITTARDLGGGSWEELTVRDRILAGEIPGPRLVCSGQPITSVKGHCHFWGGEAGTLDAAMAVLERQVQKGADLIKVMATGGNLTPGSTPALAQFDEQVLTRIVERATEHGRLVAAHCHGTAGIRNATAAGVTTIEHCSWVGAAGWGMDYDEDTARKIGQQGIWVSPTISANWRRHLGRPDFETRVRSNFARMREAGIRLIASTDAGIPNVLHHQLPLALPMFAHFAGLSPVEALRAATSDCAQAIGLGRVTGKIAEGYAADLVLVDGDVLEDLDSLAAPAQVWARGVPVL